MYKNLSERLIFFLKSFSGKLGAISISSRYIINKVLGLINGPLNNVVEYGAGTGVMTKALLKKLSPRGRLIVIESDSHFVKILKQIKDERLQIIEGGVQNQLLDKSHGFFNIDLVASSIPLSHLTIRDRHKIILDTKNMLTSKGNFILFHQYPRRSTFCLLKKNFAKVSVFFEPRNIFPSFILQAEKIKKQGS